MHDKTDHLKQLGSSTQYKYDEPSIDILETFPNRSSYSYTVILRSQEWSGLCPKTGQPDFGTITIIYTPDKNCIESKSLKLYLFSYRNYQGFMESVVNKIADDLFKACNPRHLKVIGYFAPRGGIEIIVKADRR